MGAVLDILRSAPLLIQVILFNSFQSIAGWGLNPFVIGCIVLAAYTSASCTAIARGGILAVPPTTRRAARSLGMSWFQDMFHIVLPLGTRMGDKLKVYPGKLSGGQQQRMAIAREVANRIAFFKDGLIHEIASPRQIFEPPERAETAAFLKSVL